MTYFRVSCYIENFARLINLSPRQDRNIDMLLFRTTFIRLPRTILRKCIEKTSKPLCRFINNDTNALLTAPLGRLWTFKANLQNITVNVDNYDPSLHTEEEIRIHCNHGVSDCDIDICRDEDQKLLVLQCSVQNPAEMRIALPFQVDVDLSIAGCANVSIGGLENNTIKVDIEEGEVNLGGIKSNSTFVKSRSGKVMCLKPIRGNVYLSANKGDIVTQRIQGSSISLCSMEGKVETGDIYAEDLSVVTTSGDIRMKSIHGECELQSDTGSITVGTAEGQMNVMSNNGNIKMFATKQIGNMDLTSNAGQILLLLDTDLRAQLDIEALKVDDSNAKNLFTGTKQHSNGPCIRYLAEVNNGGPRIRANALSGEVVLRSSSWMQAIMMFNKEAIS